MKLTTDDLRCFVDYVLLDEASRPPSGKRQTRPMVGFWISRHFRGPSGLRSSDRRERSFVCIEVMKRIGGKPVEKAAAEVAYRLGTDTSECVAVLRVGYYEFKNKYRKGTDELVKSRIGLFFGWRDWVLLSDGKSRREAMERYEVIFGRSRRNSLVALMAEIRHDPAQAARSRAWLEERASGIRLRLESRPKDTGPDWALVGSEASDLLTLAGLYRRLGRPLEAAPLYWRVWQIWLSSPTMAPGFREVLLRWVAVEIANTVKGAAPGTDPACHGPYGVLALLAPPAA